ncbi:hypothetical protein M433DRAFT_41074, partial [Acidomyces richmondensis BFW]
LVIVCCHATYVGTGESFAERHWLLQPFQRSDAATSKAGEHQTFMAHILVAAQYCACHPEALLVFSGGKTTESRRSEAESYHLVAKRLVSSGLFPVSVLERCATEELATDSYQNLLFSIIRFRKIVGQYPRHVTVVTHAFKERRFLELHAAAIQWPANRLRVQGINPPFSLEELDQTQKAESERAYTLFAADPYGVRSPLKDKRTARHWSPENVASMEIEDEEIVNKLISWDGGQNGTDIFPEVLPW